MPLRIAFDMDGVFADFGLACHELEDRLFGPGPCLGAGDPETEEEAQQSEDPPSAGDGDRADGAPDLSSHAARWCRDSIWHAIQSTSNFWETLKPIDEGAVARTHELMLRHRWEVFFITQRPGTEGDTVQRQTQRWLVAHGFDLPSVLVLGGSRGAAAGALRLNYHVDDSPQHCVDVMCESRARPILIVPDSDDQVAARARKLGIGTARSIGACLDILEEVTTARQEPGLLTRIAAAVGWK